MTSIDCFFLSCSHNKQSRRRKKRSYMWNQHGTSYYNNVGGDKNICRARYQQSPVEVYAKFLAIDQVSFLASALLIPTSNL